MQHGQIPWRICMDWHCWYQQLYGKTIPALHVEMFRSYPIKQFDQRDPHRMCHASSSYNVFGHDRAFGGSWKRTTVQAVYALRSEGLPRELFECPRLAKFLQHCRGIICCCNMHSWKKDGCTRILVAENQSASHPDSMTKAGVSVKETSAFLVEKRRTWHTLTPNGSEILGYKHGCYAFLGRHVVL